MDNQFWNRDYKILSISLYKFESKMQYTCDELGQRTATKLSAATVAVLS